MQVLQPHGNPWFRLLHREVEAQVRKSHGAASLKERKAKTELAAINRELKRLKVEIGRLEKRKLEVTAALG